MEGIEGRRLRLRFDHTGLNKTLFLLGKSKSDECM